jgi:uncharacterized membrane protein YsdA (DUF1294 family)
VDIAFILVALAYAVMSVVSASLYAADKRAAGRRTRRIPERTLLTIDLLGGWPGGWLARRALRHKTRKPAYRLAFAGVVLVHAVGWAAVLWLTIGGRAP